MNARMRWVGLAVAWVTMADAPMSAQLPIERATLTGHPDWIMALSFSPDGKTLASSSHDQTIRIWDIATAEQLSTIEGYTDFALCIAFSPDGKTLASGGADEKIKEELKKPLGYWGGLVRLWDFSTNKEKASFREHKHTIVSLAFSPDGKTLASGDSFDSTIRLWDMATGKGIATLKGHKQWQINCLAFSPDGRTLASGSGEFSRQHGEIKLWEVATGKERATLMGHTGPVNSLTFSPNGKTLASGSDDQTIRLWEVLTGMTRDILPGNRKESDYCEGIHLLGFNNDGRNLVSMSKHIMKIWDVTTGKETAIIKDHACLSAAMSHDGKTLACGSPDGTITLWDIPAQMKIDK